MTLCCAISRTNPTSNVELNSDKGKKRRNYGLRIGLRFIFFRLYFYFSLNFRIIYCKIKRDIITIVKNIIIVKYYYYCIIIKYYYYCIIKYYYYCKKKNILSKLILFQQDWLILIEYILSRLFQNKI